MGKGVLLGVTGGCWEAVGDVVSQQPVPMMGAGPGPAPSLPSRAAGWALPAPSSCPASLGRSRHPRQELNVLGTAGVALTLAWGWARAQHSGVCCLCECPCPQSLLDSHHCTFKPLKTLK